MIDDKYHRWKGHNPKKVNFVRYADDCAPRSCIGDEGRFLGVGLQGAGFKSPQAAKIKSLMW